MTRLLAVLTLCLVFLCTAQADEIFYGTSNFVPANISMGSTSSGGGNCYSFFASCNGGFSYGVTTAPGYFATTNMDGNTYYSGSFGVGGSINASFSDGSTLTGYLTWALVSGFESFSSPAGQWDKQLQGAFIATALTGPMWQGIDVSQVAGTFYLGSHYPHSPDFVGPVTLSITSQTPEPSTLAYIATSTGLLGLGSLKRKLVR